MADDIVKDKNGEEGSFAELFEAYSDVMNEDFQIGDKLTGKIISVGRENVFIDTGTKIDGVVDKGELLDENQVFPFKEGDILELYVVSYDGNGIRLSRTLSGEGNLRTMHEAFRKAVPVEGRVKAECKGGFHVEVMGKKAFCPISQIDTKYVENPGDYVGGLFPFIIIQFEEGGRNIIVSRRELLKKEQDKKRKVFLEGIAIGTQLEGRVTKLMPYGAFVELIPGLEGMVHIQEISWSRIERPDVILQIGDRVAVKVIGMEEGKRPGVKKVALSMKQLNEDPWKSVGSKFHIGDKIQGKVTRCVKFGAFVEIAPGIEGLVHIHEMSYRMRVLKVEDFVKAGDTVEVMVKEIDGERRRISLSMRDAEGDPWIDIQDKYKIGQSLEGILEKKEKFGFFVSLEPGITGLIPRSRIEGLHKPSMIERLAQGDTVPVIVERIDPHERKITLIPVDSRDEEDWRNYTKGSASSIGSLGEKLKRVLKSKE